ncbi:AMP-binding protein [Palleronia abyssalis]|uniref:8-demethylnovobiocic acid synthase n=1 Tax=Palleronia abyssalis TaxID=1501240 RepID=A0A2R8C109_9RHOB|nr:AMP-binding protein [Palleronia abyssalis]SPJ26049.1 8-demethylnovobiocic acid synthase [Palleronia abyssalis]
MPPSDALPDLQADDAIGFAAIVQGWAARSADAPALAGLTYGELAHRVKAAPVGREPVTAVSAEISPEAVVTAVSALSRGAVRIGPEAPAPRAKPGDLVLPVSRDGMAPELVRFPQSNLIRMATGLASRYRLSATDRIWIDGSLTEPGTWLILVAALVAGAQVLTDPDGATVAWLLNDNPVPDSKTLRTVHLRAGRDALLSLQTERPDLTVGNGLNLPEGGGLPVCTDPRDPRSVMHTTLGRPLPGMEVMIVDPRTGMDMLLYQTGEIWLRGPGVMAGFADGDAPFVQGRFLPTGVLGHLDSEGRLVLPKTEEDTLRIGYP